MLQEQEMTHLMVTYGLQMAVLALFVPRSSESTQATHEQPSASARIVEEPDTEQRLRSRTRRRSIAAHDVRRCEVEKMY